MLKTIKLIDAPKEGDVACTKESFDNGLYSFSKFNKLDEEVAKRNLTQYYIIQLL